MACSMDINVLARPATTADVHYATADRAALGLHRRGEVLHVTPRDLIEPERTVAGSHGPRPRSQGDSHE
jgi:hypothetical protein